ncbi:MAG: hypothetical protein HZA78_05220 [Candidatus Schekmanbacteria bacterium]|nr:hypothetical protein [Candidatus Schekmanbacteria bacterium]
MYFVVKINLGEIIIVDEQEQQIQEGKFFAAIAYLPVLCLVPLIFKKSNPYAVFHGKQGLILFIWEIGAFVLKIVPLLGGLIYTLSAIACFLLAAFGLIQAALGIYWKLPGVLGKWAQQVEI